MRRPGGAAIVRMRGITKRFGPVVANHDVSFELLPGEIHALLGENGAGKSTLMHILAGELEPDGGEIELDGAVTRFASPRHASRAGIGMVHQHFKLVPTMSVAANVLLNDEPGRYGRLDEDAEVQRVSDLACGLGVDIDPQATVRDTSISTQQKVEILKALHREARVLVLDEPTAVLTPQESRELFRFVRDLADRGTAVVVITHKLGEALTAADRLTVLRAGRSIFTGAPKGQTPATLARLMVGRDVALDVRQARGQAGRPVLELRDVRAVDDRGLERLRGLSLTCHAGEILGIAGVDGNGQTELVEVVTGLRRASAGELRWLGEPIEVGGAADQIRRGIAYIPEDRHARALVLDMDLGDNLVLRTFRDPPVARRWRLDRKALRKRSMALLEAYDVRAGAHQHARQLSGGNQQKVVVARELSGEPRLVVAAQPTRGVDIAATQFVYGQLTAQRDRGAAILLVSLDLDELLALSDRIAVVFEGRIVAVVPRAEADEDRLGLFMTGIGAAA